MSSAWPASHVPSSLWPEEARTAASFCIWERGGLLHGASAEPRPACPATAAAVQLLRSSLFSAPRLLPAAALPAAPATVWLLMAAFPCRQSWRAKKHCSGGQCLPWWWGWWWCCGCGGVCVCACGWCGVCPPNPSRRDHADPSSSHWRALPRLLACHDCRHEPFPPTRASMGELSMAFVAQATRC